MSFIAFDIETGPLPMDRLREILPGFDRAKVKHPGQFDPSSVKHGNTKDKALIEQKTEAERAKHAALVVSYDSDLIKAESNYWQEAKDKAALSATTGRILAIGCKTAQKETLLFNSDNCPESQLIEAFWGVFEGARKSDRSMVGFHIEDFDVPFIAQRSVILDIAVPKTLIERARYLSSTFVDLRKVWAFGGRESGGLDLVARALGLGGKTEGVTGAMFAELYENPETRPKAIEYFSRDMELTFNVAERLL